MKYSSIVFCFLAMTLQAFSDETIMEFTYSSDSHAYTYAITKSMVEKMPAWDGVSNVPLSLAQAKKIAEDHVHKELKLPALEVELITLEKILRTDRWYFVVHLAPDDLIEGKKISLDVVIFMDGTIAKPEKN